MAAFSITVPNPTKLLKFIISSFFIFFFYCSLLSYELPTMKLLPYEYKNHSSSDCFICPLHCFYKYFFESFKYLIFHHMRFNIHFLYYYKELPNKVTSLTVLYPSLLVVSVCLALDFLLLQGKSLFNKENMSMPSLHNL